MTTAEVSKDTYKEPLRCITFTFLIFVISEYIVNHQFGIITGFESNKEVHIANRTVKLMLDLDKR